MKPRVLLLCCAVLVVLSAGYPGLSARATAQVPGEVLPPFTLQVLVENAVIHGIRNTAGGSGTVVIRSYEADGFHVIEVEDDGNGLPPEIRQEREQKEQTHVGLKNIERRLDLMCHGTLTIQNKTGQGTIATIRIPKQIDP